MTRRDVILMMVGVVVIPVLGCTPQDPSIAFDLDTCEFCRMTISDRRHGAAAHTSGGRVVRFDSIECLARWVRASADAPSTIWVVDAMASGTLVALEAAVIRRTARSPMAARSGSGPSDGFVAMARSRAPAASEGVSVPWDQVLREAE